LKSALLNVQTFVNYALKDVRYALLVERTGIFPGQSRQNFALAVRVAKRRIIMSFDFADPQSDGGAIVQKPQKLVVDRVDFRSRISFVFGHFYKIFGVVIVSFR
jgi:hypothetical protein